MTSISMFHVSGVSLPLCEGNTYVVCSLWLLRWYCPCLFFLCCLPHVIEKCVKQHFKRWYNFQHILDPCGNHSTVTLTMWWLEVSEATCGLKVNSNITLMYVLSGNRSWADCRCGRTICIIMCQANKRSIRKTSTTLLKNSLMEWNTPW